MKLQRQILLLLLIFGTGLAQAKKSDIEGSQIYYQKVFLGEKDPGLYFGPSDALYWQNPYQAEFLWVDQLVKERYFDEMFIPYAEDFKLFVNSELVEGESCPAAVLGENFPFLRYLYRLISLSYLYESTLFYQSFLSREFQEHQCQVDWQELLAQCDARTEDTKKFITNAKNFLLRNHGKYLSAAKTHIDENISQALNTDGHFLKDRLDTYCAMNSDSQCLNYQKNSKSLVEKVCQQEKKLFVNICSEKDLLYGSSHVGLAHYLLSESHIVNVFESEDLAIGCLRRFSQVMQNKERRYPALETLFPIVHHELMERYGHRYRQGRLFIAGSLKEFEDKGLSQVFANKEEQAPKPVKVVKTKTEAPRKKKVEPAKKNNSEKKVVAVKKAPQKKKVKAVRKSAFLLASEILHKFSWDRVKVNMTKFKYDYVFKHDQLKRLSTTMPQYMKRKVLEEMKKYDKLGKKDGPIPLVFIKYLIETDQHQGLYNLVHTLGERFYVKNNVDKKQYVRGIDYIELVNDVSTNRNWQIYILSKEDGPKTSSPE